MAFPMTEQTAGRRAVLQALTCASVIAAASPAAAAASPDAGPKCDAACGHARTDVHCHYLPAPYKAAIEEAGLKRVDGGVPIPNWSVDDHLAMMKSRGITTSILSVSSPGLQFLDAPGKIRVARLVNETGAQLSKDHPGAFGFFAILPVPDVPACLAEMAYAFDQLQADGVVMETNSHGVYLGDPTFAPIFEELNRRRAVLYLHPTSPQCLDQIGMGFPAPMIEFPFDTARTAVSLIFNATLKRCPDIKVILSHGGGALPGTLSRIALIAEAPFLSPRPRGGSAEVIEQVRKLYFDLALSATPLTFEALMRITDASHILYGSDYPFATPAALTTNNASYEAILAGISPEHRRMIEYKNAAELFPRLSAFIRPD
jgi:predicted TIM-barrel fold metal-dependent hydrolase